VLQTFAGHNRALGVVVQGRVITGKFSLVCAILGSVLVYSAIWYGVERRLCRIAYQCCCLFAVRQQLIGTAEEQQRQHERRSRWFWCVVWRIQAALSIGKVQGSRSTATAVLLCSCDVQAMHL
jgi:hypothetical protein